MAKAATKPLPPIHPGEVLREEFLAPLNLSAGTVAKACGVPRTRIERIASEETGITADTALRLAKVFGTSAELWLNLQSDFDLQTARRKAAKEIDRIAPLPHPPPHKRPFPAFSGPAKKFYCAAMRC